MVGAIGAGSLEGCRRGVTRGASVDSSRSTTGSDTRRSDWDCDKHFLGTENRRCRTQTFAGAYWTFAQRRTGDRRLRRRFGWDFLSLFLLTAMASVLQKTIKVRHRPSSRSSSLGTVPGRRALLGRSSSPLLKRVPENPHAQGNERNNQDFPIHALLPLR